MNKSYNYILLSILAASAISCNKSGLEPENEADNELSFEVFAGTAAVETGPNTRGKRYSDATGDFAAQTFGLYAWNSSDEVVYTNAAVSKTDGKWQPADPFKWKKNTSYTFEAVYPKPAATLGTVGLTALSVNKTPGSLTFSYKVPTATMDAADNDFMLAYYSGTGTEGVAPLTFTHPLTCVNFKAGTMTGISTINSITIEGVYASGSCTVRTTTDASSNPCYSYEVSDSDNSSLWTPAGSTSVTGTSEITASSIGRTTWAYNFLLIPQDTAAKNVKLKIGITTEGGDTYNIATTLSTEYWRAGYTNTYTITYEVGGVLTATLTAVDYNEGDWFTHGSDDTDAEPFTGENW